MTTPGKSATSNGHRPDNVTEAPADSNEPADAADAATAEDVPVEPDSDASKGSGADEKSQDTTVSAEVDGPKSARAGLITRVLAALVIIGVLAGGGYAGWLLYQQRQLDTASQDARQAAEAYAVVLTSIDTNAIDQNFTDVLDGSTGEFKDMYSKSSTQLRQLLLDNKAAAQGTVLESAVQSVTPDKVVVLLFVDQSITNSSVPDPRMDRSRIKMTMEKVDGRWLAGKVELP
jgi:Mce-associated membrane protein